MSPCSLGTAQFSVTAEGQMPLSFQWNRGGLPLSDGPTPSGSMISGALTRHLTIENAGTADAGGYACTVSNSCGSALSQAATLSICYANCDCSTTAPALNVADFTCFLREFAGASAYANCDGSTTPPVLNLSDFTCFLQKFAAGCP